MRLLVPGVLLAVAAVAAACGGSSGTGLEARAWSCSQSAGFTGNVSDHGSAAATGTTLDIQAGDFFFEPTCDSAVPAGPVTLVVTNAGSALHNVSIPSVGIDQDVEAGQTIRVNVTLGSSPIQFFCKYHRTSGMVGALMP